MFNFDKYIGTNVICNLDKYILQSGEQIYFTVVVLALLPLTPPAPLGGLIQNLKTKHTPAYVKSLIQA